MFADHQGEVTRLLPYIWNILVRLLKFLVSRPYVNDLDLSEAGLYNVSPSSHPPHSLVLAQLNQVTEYDQDWISSKDSIDSHLHLLYLPCSMIIHTSCWYSSFYTFTGHQFFHTKCLIGLLIYLLTNQYIAFNVTLNCIYNYLCLLLSFVRNISKLAA